MLLLLRCCVLRYASAAAVAVYVAVAAAASGVGSGASVRTLRQFAPASFGDVLLLPEGRMVVRKRQRTALRWVRGPPPLLLPWPRIRAAPRRSRRCAVCVGAGWGADSPCASADAPPPRVRGCVGLPSLALAYPPDIGASAISSVIGSRPILANVRPVTAGCPGTVRCLWSWCSSWPTGRVGRFFPRSVSL
jgi:hypothetical protein